MKPPMIWLFVRGFTTCKIKEFSPDGAIQAIPVCM